MAIGYFLMGSPVWFGFGSLTETIGDEVSASGQTILAVVLGILLIGFGGSVIKPCVSGTVQKTAGSRATLAFAIFYMVINIGSLLGRFISWIFRTHFDLSYIFAVGAGFCVLTFFVVLFFYRDHEPSGGAQPKESKASCSPPRGHTSTSGRCRPRDRKVFSWATPTCR